MPTIHCYFENKAAAACATSALNKFCSICTAFRCLHRIWDRPLRHFEHNKNFYRICLRHRVKFPLKEGFDQLCESVVKLHCQQRGVTDERTMLYYLTFYQASFTSLLRKWVEDGCSEAPEALCPILLDCLPKTEIL